MIKYIFNLQNLPEGKRQCPFYLLLVLKSYPLFLFIEPNKRGGWKFSQKLIKGEALIRVSRVEKIPEIDKRASLFIRIRDIVKKIRRKF